MELAEKLDIIFWVCVCWYFLNGRKAQFSASRLKFCNPAEPRDGGGFLPGVSPTPSVTVPAGCSLKGTGLRLPWGPLGENPGAPGRAPPAPPSPEGSQKEQSTGGVAESSEATPPQNPGFLPVRGDSSVHHTPRSRGSLPVPGRCWGSTEGQPLHSGQGQPLALPRRNWVMWGHGSSPVKATGLSFPVCTEAGGASSPRL